MPSRWSVLSAVVCAVVAVPLRSQADVADAGLPTMQNCGPLPPTTETLPIEIRADGTIACSGRVMTLAELAVQLRTTAASHPGPRPAAGAPAQPVASRLHVLVRAAATVPFQAIAKVLQVCGRPDVLATQVHFGVRSSRDGTEGAFAYFLPSESRRDVPGRFSVTYAATGVAPTSLLGPMRRILAKRSPQPELSSIGLQLPSEAPLGDLLKLLDIAYSGGAGGVTLWVEPSAAANLASSLLRCSAQAILAAAEGTSLSRPRSPVSTAGLTHARPDPGSDPDPRPSALRRVFGHPGRLGAGRTLG